MWQSRPAHDHTEAHHTCMLGIDHGGVNEQGGWESAFVQGA